MSKGNDGAGDGGGGFGVDGEFTFLPCSKTLFKWKPQCAFDPHICSAQSNDGVLTVSPVASQHVPAAGDVQVGNGQGHAAVHRPAGALLAQVEEAAQLRVILGAEAVRVHHQVLCQVLGIGRMVKIDLW